MTGKKADRVIVAQPIRIEKVDVCLIDNNQGPLGHLLDKWQQVLLTEC